jgi:hypothetical protein
VSSIRPNGVAMDEIRDRADAGSPANGVADQGPSVKTKGKNAGSANLRPPWPKGTSGNPNGRPKGRSLTARLNDLLDQYELKGKRLPDGKQVADLVVEGLVLGAAKGGSRHLQEVFNRVEGKVADRVEHSGFGGGPIAFDATVCSLSTEQVDAWREKKRAEVSGRPTGPPG